MLFLFLNWDMVAWNSTSGEFAYIWQSKWVGIIVINTEKMQIQILRTFSSPWRRWILKSLIGWLHTRRVKEQT